MRPSAFDMQSYFIVENRKEALGPYSPKQRNRFELDEACRKLDPRRDGTPADNAWQLLRALSLTERLGAAAREGRAPAPLDCARLTWGGEPADEATCLGELSGLGEQSVDWVQDCRPLRAAPGGCIQVLTYHWFIEFDLSVGGEPIRIVVNALEDTRDVQ